MWNSGMYGGLWWEAKIYNETSRFGINGGRVFKLVVKAYGSIPIAQYDRGWVLYPFPKWEKEVFELVDWLESDIEEYEVII